MNDYSSYVERDNFNEQIYELISEYIENSEAYPQDTVLAIENGSYKLKLSLESEIGTGWDIYQIETLIRPNESGCGKEVDIDASFDIASSYFFVR
jgi:hypothetical protein